VTSKAFLLIGPSARRLKRIVGLHGLSDRAQSSRAQGLDRPANAAVCDLRLAVPRGAQHRDGQARVRLDRIGKLTGLRGVALARLHEAAPRFGEHRHDGDGLEGVGEAAPALAYLLLCIRRWPRGAAIRLLLGRTLGRTRRLGGALGPLLGTCLGREGAQGTLYPST
jgi:hypothetical protein